MSRLGFFSGQDQHSIDTMDDIFGEKDGVVFIIQHMETKLYLAELPKEITFFIEEEYTTSPEKAMQFKIRTQAAAYCINKNILFTHDVIEYEI